MFCYVVTFKSRTNGMTSYSMFLLCVYIYIHIYFVSGFRSCKVVMYFQLLIQGPTCLSQAFLLYKELLELAMCLCMLFPQNFYLLWNFIKFNLMILFRSNFSYLLLIIS
jgi:hypothetical protein